MNYWAKRLMSPMEELLVNEEKQAFKQLIKEYNKAFNKVNTEIELLYNKISVDGQPSITELYRFNRFYELMAKINAQLKKLGANEQNIMFEKLYKAYLSSAQLVNNQMGVSLAVINTDAAKKAIENVWCQDGKVWSERIWAHMGKLQEELTDGLLDMILTGTAPDKVSQNIQERFGVSYSNAARLVRTEMNHIQTEAAKDRYIEAGFKAYQVLATDDHRTCEICNQQNGKIYDFAQYMPGITAPPFHPNARCVIIPVKYNTK